MLRLSLITFGVCLVMLGWALLIARRVPAQSAWIAFVSSRDGNLEIYKMRPDGSRQTRLTDYRGNDLFPIWTRDGHWLLFASDRSSVSGYPTRQIYRMRADGRQVEKLTEAPCLHHRLTWNADRTRVLSACWTWTGTDIRPTDYYQMEPDGSHRQPLSEDLAYVFTHDTPRWSADGKWIVYVEKDRGDPTLYRVARMRVDGTEQQLLTPDQNGFSPDWSPDGRIVFASADGLYQFDPAAENVQKITANRSVYFIPAWSPDGEWIAFSTIDTAQQDIYRIQLKNGKIEQLTQTRGDDLEPVWSPIIDLPWRFSVIVGMGIGMMGAGIIFPARPSRQIARASWYRR